jgi:hypothetical protein
VSDYIPSAEALRRRDLREAEERALADLQKWDCLLRNFGGWWTVPGPVNGPGQHQGPHKAATIKRLVARKAVVIVGDDRCLLYPERRGDSPEEADHG